MPRSLFGRRASMVRLPGQAETKVRGTAWPTRSAWMALPPTGPAGGFRYLA